MEDLVQLFSDNWPVILVVLAIALVTLGLLRKLLKLAFLGAIVGVAGLFLQAQFMVGG